MIKDFHDLPRLKDSISYIYVEHAAINQNNTAVVIAEGDGYTQIPIANMVCLMLGPGTSITHAAIRTICENVFPPTATVFPTQVGMNRR